MPPIKWELTKPIHNLLGQPMTLVEMRPPTGLDILQNGYPYATRRNARTGETEEVVNTANAMALIAACIGTDINGVTRMAAVDVYEAMEALRVFFHFKIRPKSSPSTSAPEDGAETQDLSLV